MGKKEKRKKEKKKVHLSYFPKADFCLFFFYWNKKLSNASQKAENILQY